jgi:hypothetical protein
MSLADAFAPAEARYKAEVMANTWGHLYPEPRKKYPGYVIFAHGAFGDMVVIQNEFDDLPDSPWFFEDLRALVMKYETEAGKIYKFDGYYMKYKNGNHAFCGRTMEVNLPKHCKGEYYEK